MGRSSCRRGSSSALLASTAIAWRSSSGSSRAWIDRLPESPVSPHGLEMSPSARKATR
jgi:hypothetical protein